MTNKSGEGKSEVQSSILDSSFDLEIDNLKANLKPFSPSSEMEIFKKSGIPFTPMPVSN